MKSLVGILCWIAAGIPLALFVSCTPVPDIAHLASATPSQFPATKSAHEVYLTPGGEATRASNPVTTSTGTAVFEQATQESPQATRPEATARPTANSHLRSSILFERNGDTWVLDVETDTARMVAQGFYPYSWSPSGKFLLLGDESGLWVAAADGSNPHRVFELPEGGGAGEGSRWLTDDFVLIEVRFPVNEPRIYYLNLESGSIEKPEPDRWRQLEAVSSAGLFWIESSSDGFERVDLQGSRVKLTDIGGVGSAQPFIDPNLALLSSGRQVVYYRCWPSCSLNLADISPSGLASSTPIFGWEGETAQHLRVSPNGRYVGFTRPHDTLYVLDMQDPSRLFKWQFGVSIAPSYFLWSPDSTAVVFQSLNETTGYFGLAKLDVQTGDVHILTEGGVSAHDNVWDWRDVPTQN